MAKSVLQFLRAQTAELGFPCPSGVVDRIADRAAGGFSWTSLPHQLGVLLPPHCTCNSRAKLSPFTHFHFTRFKSPLVPGPTCGRYERVRSSKAALSALPLPLLSEQRQIPLPSVPSQHQSGTWSCPWGPTFSPRDISSNFFPKSVIISPTGSLRNKTAVSLHNHAGEI